MPQSTRSRTGFGSLQDTETEAWSTSSAVFEPELVEKSVTTRKNCLVRPNALSNTGPMHVVIPPEGNYWIDPGSFKINADFKIKKWSTTDNTWKDLDSDDSGKVAPVNMFTKRIFKDIETYIQQQRVSLVATAAYPVKAFLETFASYGLDAERGHLRASYWQKDLPGKHDSPADNTSFGVRHNFIAESRSVKMCEMMHTELTSLDRYLVPGLDMTFVFSLNDPGFYLQTLPGDTTKYSIDFEDFYLSFDRILLSEHIDKAIESKLKSKNAIYPVHRGTLRTKQIPANEHNALWQSMYTGSLPETVTICMIDSKAFNGDKEKNIFNFQHFNLESIVLRVNSQSVPGQPLVCDFGKDEAIRAYRHFFDNVGVNNSNNPSLMTYEDFLKGATIFPFDLTPDKCALFHGHIKQNGGIELDIKFKSALTTGITILALCSYTDRFHIGGPIENREIFMNPALTD